MKKIKVIISEKIIVIVMYLITIFRIWLSSIMNYQVIVKGGSYDDWLQVKNAVEIINGRWLGSYSNSILVKNESYPLFLASCRFFNIPYGIGYGLFIVLTSVLFVVAIRPLISNKNLRRLIYLFLIYQPVGLLSTSALRIYRNAFVPWAILACCSCYLAIYYRRNNAVKSLIPWGIGGGIFTSFFWLLREDSIWMAPFIGGVTIFCIVYWIYQKSSIGIKGIVSRTIAILLPVVFILLASESVKLVNYNYYGIALTNDRNQGEISRVSNLLYSIEDEENDNNDIWVSRGALRQAMEVSPTLDSLKNLEKSFEDWSFDGVWVTGDMCTWALRATVNDNGYFKDAVETQNFYKQIGDELEAAFADGRLQKKDAILISGIGGLYLEDFTESLLLSLQTIKEFALNKQTDLCTDIYYTDGEERDITLAENLLLKGIPRTDEQLEDIDANHFNRVMNKNIIKEETNYVVISVAIIRLYQVLSWVISILAVAGYLFMLYKLLFKRDMQIFPVWISSTAVMLTAFVNVYVMVLFSRWMSRDPASETYAFYAPAA